MLQRAVEKNIQTWIDGMDRFNSTPEFGTTRILFTKPELENRAYVKAEMRKLGLEVSEDGIGNIFATLIGSDPMLAPVWTGSHIDTVPNAGKFDGMAGVACGMEALRLIGESGERHKRNLTVVVFTSEEPTRFGLSCLGSRAMSGDLTLEATKKLLDQGGTTLFDKLQELGYDLADYPAIKKNDSDVFASVELHIEQNNRLEKKKASIGIVEKICAPSIYTVEIEGMQSHAGGTDMMERRDAFAASCEISLMLEKLAKECNSEYNTATIGRVEVIPNAVNVIPGKTKFSIDIRDCNMATKQELIQEMMIEIEAIAENRQVKTRITEENNDAPLVCDTRVVACIEKSCHDLGISPEYMISGPYHDTLFVGRFAPASMIFVPSRNGISHNPDEWTDYKQLALGTDVLVNALLNLANLEETL